VAALDQRGNVCGCLRFLEESRAGGFDDLWLSRSALAGNPAVGAQVRRAAEIEIARARLERVRFGEVGGWAISKERRRSLEAVRIILATYGLLQLLGGCIGMATATLRHSSATILRRIGLREVVIDDCAVPAYYDAKYNCQMEILSFDSRNPN